MTRIHSCCDRLKNLLRPPEAKASRTARLLALESGGRARWTPRDYAALAREGYVQQRHRASRGEARRREAPASLLPLLYEGGAERDAHPLLDLLARPNPRQDGAAFLEALYAHLLLAGNAYIEAVRDRRRRCASSTRCGPTACASCPAPTAGRRPMNTRVGGRTRALRAGQAALPPILHLTLFHPLDDHYGLAPLEAAAVAVDTHNAAARWNKALLDNAARPSGALVYAGPEGALLSDGQFERLKRELETTYQGAANAGRPLLLEGGLDWKAMSLSPKDMDFLEAKHAAAREIALAFGVPPMLLGIPGDNTYSNYQEANRVFWRRPCCRSRSRIGCALAQWLRRRSATSAARGRHRPHRCARRRSRGAVGARHRGAVPHASTRSARRSAIAPVEGGDRLMDG